MILDEPSMQALRQRIDTFMADEETRAQYDGLIAKGQALQEKQQKSVALTGEEISEFEQQRDSLLKNPVADAAAHGATVASANKGVLQAVAVLVAIIVLQLLWGIGRASLDAYRKRQAAM